MVFRRLSFLMTNVLAPPRLTRTPKDRSWSHQYVCCPVAGIGSDRTVMHVDHVPEPRIDAGDGDIRAITLRPEEYRRLAEFVHKSFKNEGGERPVHHYGYDVYDSFYDARGHYSAITTCNAWTGDALRHAGVRVGAWTPFPVTVLGWFAS